MRHALGWRCVVADSYPASVIDLSCDQPPTSRAMGGRGAKLIRTNVRSSAKGLGSPVEVDGRHALPGGGADGRTVGPEMIVAGAVGLIVDHLRVGIDGVHILQPMLQHDALGVLPN